MARSLPVGPATGIQSSGARSMGRHRQGPHSRSVRDRDHTPGGPLVASYSPTGADNAWVARQCAARGVRLTNVHTQIDADPATGHAPTSCGEDADMQLSGGEAPLSAEGRARPAQYPARRGGYAAGKIRASSWRWHTGEPRPPNQGIRFPPHSGQLANHGGEPTRRAAPRARATTGGVRAAGYVVAGTRAEPGRLAGPHLAPARRSSHNAGDSESGTCSAAHMAIWQAG
jgi:hypothetical protein